MWTWIGVGTVLYLLWGARLGWVDADRVYCIPAARGMWIVSWALAWPVLLFTGMSNG